MPPKPMKPFRYKDGELYAEGVSVRALAEEYGTPLFIYSRNYLLDRYRALADAMKEVNPLICYAVKANTNAAIIQTLAAEGAGADVVSVGELLRARRAGVPADKIVFAGVGKTREEIVAALEEDILQFTVESEPELDRISQCANKLNKTARVALRVNPDVDPKTHKYISTGKKENKFGLDIRRARNAYRHAARLPNVEVAGLHMHIGSQILSADPFAKAIKKITPLLRELKEAHPSLKHLDIGGGLGICYRKGQNPLSEKVYARAVVPLLKKLELKIIMEPGRYIAGNAGVLATRVQYMKEGHKKRFVVVDAAMNDLIRPALYQAHHDIEPVRQTEDRIYGDVVGPICESGDFFAEDATLPYVGVDDLLVIHSAGAYASAMASNYNSRGRPAEVMVNGDAHALVRKREDFDDLIRGESIPEW